MTPDRCGRRRILRAAVASCAYIALPAISLAQSYPARPVKLICPWPAGGSSDAVMRALANSASRHLGQQVFVENKPGASTLVGVGELAGARPDGYTLGQVPQTVLRVAHMQKIAFDPRIDLTWIVCLTGYATGIVVMADSPIKSMKELVDYAKANPGKFAYGSPGTGSSPHLVMEAFAMHAGIALNHIPFKGNAENMQALLGGHIMAVSDASGWAPQVDSGRVRLLATFGSQRTKRWPHVPTLQDLGYEAVADSPFGVCGPKGMDAGTVRTIHDVFKKTLDDPAVLAAFQQFDQSIVYMDTETYTKWARDTFAAEKSMIERLGLAAKS